MDRHGDRRKNRQERTRIISSSSQGKAEFLINPTLDDGFYQQLKTVRGSSASKPNIDPIEKIYRCSLTQNFSNNVKNIYA